MHEHNALLCSSQVYGCEVDSRDENVMGWL